METPVLIKGIALWVNSNVEFILLVIALLIGLYSSSFFSYVVNGFSFRAITMTFKRFLPGKCYSSGGSMYGIYNDAPTRFDVKGLSSSSPTSFLSLVSNYSIIKGGTSGIFFWDAIDNSLSSSWISTDYCLFIANYLLFALVGILFASLGSSCDIFCE